MLCVLFFFNRGNKVIDFIRALSNSAPTYTHPPQPPTTPKKIPPPPPPPGRRSFKMRRAVYSRKGCHASSVCTHLRYFFSYFWQYFCLIVSCFTCRNFTLPLFKKRRVHQKRLFFSKKIDFCRKLFLLKIIFANRC